MSRICEEKFTSDREKLNCSIENVCEWQWRGSQLTRRTSVVSGGAMSALDWWARGS
jgi:hypothetical protein